MTGFLGFSGRITSPRKPVEYISSRGDHFSEYLGRPQRRVNIPFADCKIPFATSWAFKQSRKPPGGQKKSSTARWLSTATICSRCRLASTFAFVAVTQNPFYILIKRVYGFFLILPFGPIRVFRLLWCLLWCLLLCLLWCLLLCLPLCLLWYLLWYLLLLCLLLLSGRSRWTLLLEFRPRVKDGFSEGGDLSRLIMVWVEAFL